VSWGCTPSSTSKERAIELTDTKVPLRYLQEFPLQRIQLLRLDTADFGIMCIRAKDIALGLRAGADSGDEEAMDGEGGESEGREVLAGDVDVS